MPAQIPTPFHLLDKSLKVYAPQETTESTGATQWNSVLQPYTLRASVQPASSNASLQYGRETNSQQVDVYFAPIASDGSTPRIKQGWVVEADGVRYRVQGVARDPILNGCIGHLVAEVQE